MLAQRRSYHPKVVKMFRIKITIQSLHVWGASYGRSTSPDALGMAGGPVMHTKPLQSKQHHPHIIYGKTMALRS